MKKINDLFISQKNNFRKNLISINVKERVKKIKRIQKWITKNENLIINTSLQDYKKPIPEFYTTEFKPVLNHIKITLKNIKKWSSSKSVRNPIHLLGTRSKIYYEPKGTCLIISPWNYPFSLTLNPVISAISAGNCIIVKPSELTPNMSSLISTMLSSIFEENEVKVVEGGKDVGEYLINLKFDHIYFTGSPKIGSIVMQAAAKNLSSITLELGGANHTIVDETANIQDAAEKILWTKYLNCGQTCIAVNHVFVHSKNYDIFLSKLVMVLEKFFSNNSDYGDIVNKQHIDRLKNILKITLNHSGQFVIDSNSVSKIKKEFPITILKDLSVENPILKNEIFGPILPILVYNDLNSVLDFIRKGEKPLALYLFSKSTTNIKKFLNLTSSGGVAINECMLQYANPYLPFGGVNNSGMGKSGGKQGFLSFSNEKSVLFQRSGFSIAKLIYPPYTNIKQKLAQILG